MRPPTLDCGPRERRGSPSGSIPNFVRTFARRGKALVRPTAPERRLHGRGIHPKKRQVFVRIRVARLTLSSGGKTRALSPAVGRIASRIPGDRFSEAPHMAQCSGGMALARTVSRHAVIPSPVRPKLVQHTTHSSHEQHRLYHRRSRRHHRGPQGPRTFLTPSGVVIAPPRPTGRDGGTAISGPFPKQLPSTQPLS